MRRSERALGQAIRAGQERGDIARQGDSRPFHHRDDNTVVGAVQRMADIGVSESDWRGNGAGIKEMTDGVTDDQFEQALDTAQGEGNVSRANIVRKVREVQSGAEVMVRRSERALGQSIRGGQERGEIGDKSMGGNVRQQVVERNSLPSPKEYLPNSHEMVDAYALTDGVTDDQFETALDTAQGEGNVSRANIVRKVREVQSGAEVMVRRSERALGQAIRGGQERGEIIKNGDIGGGGRGGDTAAATRNFSRKNLDRPADFASASELYGNNGAIYDMTDDVTDEDFEAAIDRAQDEQNVSRANIVRTGEFQLAKNAKASS